MKALTYHGDHQIRYETVRDPEILDPTDVIIKVSCCAICGSDLHVVEGREKGCDHGTPMGHEFVGEIVETGNQVTAWKTGDAVMSPFTTNCGQCAFCRSGLTSRCTQGQLFGWVQDRRGLPGGQAEYVRVPLADHTLLAIPEGLTGEQALLLGDVIPTGYYCAHQAGITPDGAYVVMGCGPVGLMAILGARELGATSVWAIDRLPERLKLAESFGAIAIHAGQHDPVAIVKAHTHGLGADSVLEAVGSNESLLLAYQLVRAGGIISTVGVNTSTALPFSPTDAYNKNLTFRTGRCPARFFMEKLLPVVLSGKYDYPAVITHRLELPEGPRGYEMFAGKKDQCIKVVFHF